MKQHIVRSKKVNFNDTDNNSSVTVQSKHFKNASDKPVAIKDSITPPEHREGYISIPSKLPLNLIIAWVVQLVILVGVGTSAYTSMKSDQAVFYEKLTRIENNMYTNQEAKLRIEIQDSKIDQLRKEIEAKGK